MAQIPAFCDRCGEMFPSGFDLEGFGISLQDIRVGPCPRCGGYGHTASGVFNIVGGVMEVLSTSDEISRERLWRLRHVLELQRLSGASPEAAERRILAEVPEARGWLNEFQSMGPITRLVLLLTIVDFVLNHQEQIVDVGDAVVHIVELVSRSSW